MITEDNIKNSYYYKEIEKEYKGKSTKRNNVPYMNHINEGIQVLINIKASENVIAAFCLHPLFQDNKSLMTSLSNKSLINKINKEVLILLIEYRKAANYYSSRSKEVSAPRLSPIRGVNEMLLADKVQNYRDFKENQKPGINIKKERYDWLDDYFKKWEKALFSYFNLNIIDFLEK